MLIHPTLDSLRSLKLFGMAKALEAQMEMPEAKDLCFEERIGLLVDQEVSHRDNRQLTSRLKAAKLRQTACMEDLDLRIPRGLDRSLVAALASCQWAGAHQNILIVGPTGIGKSYLACAFAQKACREGFTAQYERTSRLFQELALAKEDGRYVRLLNSISRKDVLVLDDFAMTALIDEQRRDLLEIVEDRYEKRSTIITSQTPLEHWHKSIGDSTFADAIMDRLIHNAHKLCLKGDSMRKGKNKGEQSGK